VVYIEPFFALAVGLGKSGVTTYDACMYVCVCVYEKALQVIVSAGKVPIVADCTCNYRHEASRGF